MDLTFYFSHTVEFSVTQCHVVLVTNVNCGHTMSSGHTTWRGQSLISGQTMSDYHAM